MKNKQIIVERLHCNCGNLTERISTRISGKPVFSDTCRTCRGRARYGIIKKSSCEKCNFLPKTPNQLEIDHIDGNNKNNDISNLMTLCCNCHAYKSYINNDLVFRGKDNPFYGKKHSIETLEKIKLARMKQTEKRKYVL